MKRFVIVATLLVALVGGTYFGFIQPRQIQSDLCARASALIYRARKHPPAGIDEGNWRNYLVQLEATIPNRFLPGYCPRDRVAELVRQLEAKWPAGPRTFTDLLEMSLLMEKLHPNWGSYGYSLRYDLWAGEGVGPKPPEPK